MNREPHSRSCWPILALLVAMLALLVAILSLLLAIFSPTCPKMFRNRPRQPPRCLRHRQDSPQDAQTPLPSLPKVQKTYKNLWEYSKNKQTAIKKKTMILQTAAFAKKKANPFLWPALISSWHRGADRHELGCKKKTPERAS